MLFNKSRWVPVGGVEGHMTWTCTLGVRGAMLMGGGIGGGQCYWINQHVCYSGMFNGRYMEMFEIMCRT